MDSAHSIVRFFCFCLLNFSLTGADDSTLDLLVLGDFGGLPYFPYRTYIEAAVAKQMGKFAAANQVDNVLTLGDNFYYDGVKNVNDPRFQETYSRVFSQKSLEVDWFFLAGNHDHRGNVSAQIEFTRYLKRWQYPDYYYKVQLRVPRSQLTVDLLMLDTILLCGNSDDFSDQQPGGAVDLQAAGRQWLWLEQNLKQSRADYLLVAGHYPVYSIAEHGPTAELVAALMPMLHKYGVTAYLSGHDHNLQHLQSIGVSGRAVDYFVSGAANFIDHSRKHRHAVPTGASKFIWDDTEALGGFGYLQAAPRNMTFTFFEANGTQLYQHVMLPRKRSAVGPDLTSLSHSVV